MFQTVELPLWLLILILAFAAIAALTHVLVPPVRWFFRRRMERLVGRLNARLDRPIQPFKLMLRADMIVRLVHDPQVMQAVVAEAEETGEPESVVLSRARRYAREIVPSFSATLYFKVGARAAKWFARMIYKVRIGHFDAERMAVIDREATVIFVMNHRSNMDYVLVTYLAARRTALSYAVGEWARIWPLSALIRSMGAYFIRRRSQNPLYRRVLARYVQMATEEGVAQAIFPEGGLSLTGEVGPARMGLISYVLSGFRPEGRDVVFIPVAINYDRVLEDRVLVGAAEAGERRFRAPVLSIMGFVLRHLRNRLRGRFLRFGYAVVGFGRPLSLTEFHAGFGAGFLTGGQVPAETLAAELMARVIEAMPVLPMPLACAALGGYARVPAEEFGQRLGAMLLQLSASGHHVQMPGKSVERLVEEGLRRLIERKLVRIEGTDLRVAPANAGLIAFYARSINQLLDAPAA